MALLKMSRLAQWRNWAIFKALRDHPHFRWFWIGKLASSATFRIGTVARGWLVYQLTGSAFALGWVSSGWSVSTLLLSLYGGAVADRFDKRNLLVWTRLAMMANTLILALLISTGVIQVWHLVISSLVRGILFSFMMPARQAIVPELVDQETLLNAISLNSVGMGVMGILFSLVAGYVVEVMGIGGAYYIIVGLYLVTFLTLLKIPPTGARKESPTSVWEDLKQGVSYIGSQATLMVLLGLGLARVLFAMPYRTFMPKFAQEVMGMDASGLGVLTAAPAVGSLISSLTMASLEDFGKKGKLLLASGIATGGSLVLFANTPYLVPVLLFLALLGMAGNACMVTGNTLLQVNVQASLRGRVMSMYMMLFGLSPLGTLPAGRVADRLGVPFVVTIEGVLLSLVFLGVGLGWPKIRRLK